jgi:DNA-binding SARP family transcriptional activator
LIASPDDVDALRFERLVGDASESRENPERRRSICTEALGLWRGRPFGDLADDEGFRLEAYRLDELRLFSMELSLEAELDLGHHELVIGELESAVEEHPYREHLRILLATALARSDRRVEALRACARLRHELAAVGLGPSDELITIENSILAGPDSS